MGSWAMLPRLGVSVCRVWRVGGLGVSRADFVNSEHVRSPHRQRRLLPTRCAPLTGFGPGSGGVSFRIGGDGCDVQDPSLPVSDPPARVADEARLHRSWVAVVGCARLQCWQARSRGIDERVVRA